jgi:hypothetical protein
MDLRCSFIHMWLLMSRLDSYTSVSVSARDRWFGLHGAVLLRSFEMLLSCGLSLLGLGSWEEGLGLSSAGFLAAHTNLRKKTERESVIDVHSSLPRN